MNIKPLLSVVLLLAIVGGVWWYVTKGPGSQMQEEQHALIPTTQENQDYKYTESTNLYDIEATWPSKVPLATAQASSKARLTLEQKLKTEIEAFKTDGNFSAFTEEDIKIQGITAERKYALKLEYKGYDAPGYHSYVYTVYVDTLGAHPNGYFLTVVFDANGGEVKLQDLFRTDRNWLEELSLLVSNNVAAQLKERLGDSLDSGVEGPDVTEIMYAEGVAPKVENFENFIIDGDALVIYLPPYQVAAYAAGSFEVRIPLKDLSDLLKPGVTRLRSISQE